MTRRSSLRAALSSLLVLVLVLVPMARAASEWGTNGYVEYRPGTGALVLSAPHGGDLEPASIPDRAYGTTVTDSNTIDVATLVQDGFPEASRPHLIICHLARTKLDANREIIEAAQGNEEAELAWEEYHGFIERARATVAETYGRGLYVDIHGQSHPENWTECGLLLTAAELNSYSDDDLDDPAVANLTSFRNLIATTQVRPHHADAGALAAHSLTRPPPYSARDRVRGGGQAVDAGEILRGASSVCGLLETYGYAGVPSPTNPGPGTGNYFSGGYSTDRHSSVNGTSVRITARAACPPRCPRCKRKRRGGELGPRRMATGGTIDGIQIEICGYVRRTSAAIRERFSADLVQSTRVTPPPPRLPLARSLSGRPLMGSPVACWSRGTAVRAAPRSACSLADVCADLLRAVVPLTRVCMDGQAVLVIACVGERDRV